MRLKLFATLAVLGTLVSFIAGAQQTAKITSSNIAYLEYLPQGYSGNSNLYPLVISLHGIKERGTTSTDPAALLSSVQKVAYVGLPKYVKYGKQYPFILVSPQLKDSYGTWPAAYIMDVINHVKKYLRVDPKRIYITGLSLGGFGVWTAIGAYPSVFAAAVPICPGGNALNKACAIAADNVAVWGFHGDKDYIVSYTVTTNMINAMNACTPKPSPLAKATLFAGMSHSIWDKVYNETTALDWMLSFTNGSTTSSTSNTPPTVTAGTDLSLTLPSNVAYCNGSASDSDGSVTSYAWSQVSGPSSATLENKTTKSLKASNLLAGTYTFRLKATDDKGAYANDDVKVVVNSTNSAPTVSAGADKSITLPTNSLYIQGSASDADGIASYTWTKVSGGTASLSGQTTSTLRAYNLVAGTYYFRLTVKDNKGYSKYDDMKVTVLSSTNSAPTVSAGADKSITLPTNSLYIQGSASDADGIASYTWTKVSGGTASLSQQTTPTLRAYNLVAGTYYFRLTVKDNKGYSKYDDMKVTVLSSTSNLAPVANAGADKTLTLPTNSIKLYGSAKDSDGTIASYQWSQYGGPTPATISYATSPAATFSNLKAGNYYFRLTVRDNDGATDIDNVLVKVVNGTVSIINLDAPLESMLAFAD